MRARTRSERNPRAHRAAGEARTTAGPGGGAPYGAPGTDGGRAER
ncbi:hypothetical protein [Streptomyces sp. SAJ15]|nr:hypothetical protein [Streptomyces sp. SAJ15]